MYSVLIETLDDVVDVCKKVMEQLSIEQPDIPEKSETWLLRTVRTIF